MTQWRKVSNTSTKYALHPMVRDQFEKQTEWVKGGGISSAPKDPDESEADSTGE